MFEAIVFNFKLKKGSAFVRQFLFLYACKTYNYNHYDDKIA